MKFLFQTTILLFAFCATGCFEVREEVNMKADGSGEILLLVNLSESRESLKNYLKLEKTADSGVPKDKKVVAALNDVEAVLKRTKGISYVQVKQDWSGFVFSVSGRFANVEALNEAITTLSMELEYLKVPPVNEANFRYNGGQFQRLFNLPESQKEYQKLSSVERYALEQARLISIYRFEKTIRNYSNRQAKLSPSGKAIMLQLPVADLAKGAATLANTISF